MARLGSTNGLVVANSDVIILKETVNLFTLMSGCCQNDVRIPITARAQYVRDYKESLPRRTIYVPNHQLEYTMFDAMSTRIPNDPRVNLRARVFGIVSYREAQPQRTIKKTFARYNKPYFSIISDRQIRDVRYRITALNTHLDKRWVNIDRRSIVTPSPVLEYRLFSSRSNRIPNRPYLNIRPGSHQVLMWRYSSPSRTIVPIV